MGLHHGLHQDLPDCKKIPLPAALLVFEKESVLFCFVYLPSEFSASLSFSLFRCLSNPEAFPGKVVAGLTNAACKVGMKGLSPVNGIQGICKNVFTLNVEILLGGL